MCIQPKGNTALPMRAEEPKILGDITMNDMHIFPALKTLFSRDEEPPIRFNGENVFVTGLKCDGDATAVMCPGFDERRLRYCRGKFRRWKSFRTDQGLRASPGPAS